MKFPLIALCFSFVFSLYSEGVSIGKFENGDSDGWTFYNGKEFPPGAQGTFAIIEDTSSSSGSSAYLEGAFASGGAYVSISRSLPSPLPFKALKFKVKSSDYDAITIRLTDGSGQVHQQVVPLKKDDSGWQELVVKDFKGAKRYTNWGGAKDGKWHEPLKGVSFLLERVALNEELKSGKAFFSDIVLEK